MCPLDIHHQPNTAFTTQDSGILCLCKEYVRIAKQSSVAVFDGRQGIQVEPDGFQFLVSHVDENRVGHEFVAQLGTTGGCAGAHGGDELLQSPVLESPGGSEVGGWGIAGWRTWEGPPEKPGPWQRVHNPARYSPYSAVALRAGVAGRGLS